MTNSIPEAVQTIFQRHSCRHFRNTPIPDNHIQLLLEAFRHAPSAGNRQPWHVYVVQNPEIREELMRAAYGQDFIAEAPVVFVVCAIPDQSASRYGKRGETLYVYQDTAAAIENLLLTATALHYGSCWVGAFEERRVREILNLPAQFRPIAIIPVGEPAEPPEPTERKPIEQITTFLT